MALISIFRRPMAGWSGWGEGARRRGGDGTSGREEREEEPDPEAERGMERVVLMEKGERIPAGL